MTQSPQNTRRVAALVEKALSSLDQAIRLCEEQDKGAGDMTQLTRFRSQLEAIMRELETGKITGRHVGMGRAIVDTWPFDSELGEQLLAAEQEYLKLAR